MDSNVSMIQSANGTMVQGSMNTSPEETHLLVSRSKEDEVTEQQAGGYDLSDEEAAADSSSSSASSQNSPREACFTSPNWPQSYKKSMNTYSNVVSPTFGFFSPPVKLSSPVLSYCVKCTPSSNDKASPLSESLSVPLLQEKAENIQLNRELVSVPPLHNGKAFRKVHLKETLQPQRDSHAECHLRLAERRCSFMQATVNGINVLAGVGVLSTPYALKQGGWISLIVLLFFALICCYTGILLRHCLESKPGLATYPDIGGAAFGISGRLIVSMILYTELYACSVEFLILEGDNLSSLFPGAHLNVFGYQMDSPKFFTILAALLVLPTVWLRDLSRLSYLSAGGVIASIVIVLAVFWVGAIDGIGFHNHGRFADLANLPMSVGLFGFCYSGHAVFPDIYSSMKNPTQFNRVLQVSFVVCTIMYGGVGVLGYRMFGQETESQVTLNLPKTFLASQIAIWTTVINPLTKYHSKEE
ncbi:hypothetical protein O6H91_14G043500 [Diphasiastrum complanatum]|uniref:Uncharacterized protein n=1 Tax=Diphasiastrum complanatum TaxID=34168 RepID=A0ACC2BNT7_DIPCM|nr:hypothetical protein O6H91_14G043500 [Diphasiastrum complanatum]